MVRVHYLQRQLELERQKRSKELCDFSENLAKFRKEAQKTEGALLCNIHTREEMIKFYKREGPRMRDALASGDRQISNLTKLCGQMAKQHQGEVTYLQQQLIAANSEKKLLKQQQMRSLRRKEQQHHQVLQLQQQMAELVMQNKKLQQQARQAEALRQELRVSHPEAEASSSGSCIVQRGSSNSNTAMATEAHGAQTSSELQQQQQQAHESAEEQHSLLSAGTTSSSSSVGVTFSSPTTSELSTSQSDSSTAAAIDVSDDGDTAADVSDEVDGVCFISSPFGMISDQGINTGSIAADSRGAAGAINLFKGSSSSVGASKQIVRFEHSSSAWQELCTEWADGWLGA